jgi:acyl-CoA thioester hydrolase
MVEARIRVIYGDTDQMGVVYHANYFRYFEVARGEFFRARGGSYRDLEGEGLMLPVVEATAAYKSPARYDDVLLVRARVGGLKRVSLTFHYELWREGAPEALLCTGQTVHACVDRDGKLTRLPPALVHLLQMAP